MGIVDVLILFVILILCIFALSYVAHHKDQCLGCGGDCSQCGKSQKKSSEK